MKPLAYTTNSTKETQKIARLFAQELLKSDFDREGALVVALEGDLGGGKTTFAQGFARGLGIRARILSPTFVILKKFNIPRARAVTARYHTFIHIDAYRIEHTKELQILGWSDIIKDTTAIVLVEWADRVRQTLPKDGITIKFEFIDKKTRKIIITNHNK